MIDYLIGMYSLSHTKHETGHSPPPISKESNHLISNNNIHNQIKGKSKAHT